LLEQVSIPQVQGGDMLDVMVIKEEAREAVLRALREQGHEPLVDEQLAGAAIGRGEQCQACCAGQHAAAALRELYGRETCADGLYRYALQAVEKPLIETVLQETGGNQVAAAKVLGINRNTLRSRIRRLGIRVPGR
jgi:two-component system nitrogen regulation response regulator GlnG